MEISFFYLYYNLNIVENTAFMQSIQFMKRQYKIENGNIEYMFDSALKIDDEILQNILGKSSDSKTQFFNLLKFNFLV